jgi:hypothetical protein
MNLRREVAHGYAGTDLENKMVVEQMSWQRSKCLKSLEINAKERFVDKIA